MGRKQVIRKRCKMDGAISRLAEDQWLDVEEAATHLGITVDDFQFHLLIGRIDPAIDGKWHSKTLALRTRTASAGLNYRSGIYVIQFMEFIKIGYSDKLLQRLAGLQDSLPLRIKVHVLNDGMTRKAEKRLHERFKAYRTRGEWFRLEGRLAEWIKAGCQ